MQFDLTQSQEMGMMGIAEVMKLLNVKWDFTRIKNVQVKGDKQRRLHWVGSRYDVPTRNSRAIEVSLCQPPIGYGWYPVCAKINLAYFGGTGYRVFRFRYNNRGFALPRPEVWEVEEESAGQLELDWDLGKCHTLSLGCHKAAGGTGHHRAKSVI